MRTVLIVVITLLAIGFVCEERTLYQSATQELQEDTEFVLVIDRSGSMRGDRIEEAKRAATDFVDALLANQRAAVIAFDDRVLVVHEMSADKASLAQAIEGITAGFWTSFAPALFAAQEQFSQDTNNVIIFLSDGVDEEPERVSEALEQLVSQGTCIYTVAYAADEGADVLLGGMADQSLDVTGCGNFFQAQENGFDLEYVFATMRRELSGQEIIDVTAEITQTQASITANHRGEDLYTDPCFSPTATITLWQDGSIVLREHTDQKTLPLSISSGTYDYEVTVTERCDNNCFAHGTTSGEIYFEATDVCTFTEQDYFLLVQPDIVTITEDGFSPRTIGTAGTVVWNNQDTQPRQVLGVDGEWESPLILPGQNWSKTFLEGVHGYTDEEGTFTGTVRATRTTEPTQFVFVFDNSGSMAGEPLQAAKEVAISFVDLLSPQDRVSFIVFDQRVRLLQDGHTTDKTRLVASIEGIRAEGFSLYIPALRLAGQELEQQYLTRRPVVIFLSDGLPRDPEGTQGILNTIDTHLSGACLHIVAYLSADQKAQELLETMAERAYQNAQCGALYAVASDGQELRAVLGEIYVSTQPHLLEFTDTTVSRSGGELTIRTRVQSTQTRLELPSTTSACLPKATVRAVVGVTEHFLTYDGTHYTATIEVPRGVRSVDLVARITAEESARTATAHATLTVPRGLPWGWLVLAGLGVLLVVYASRK